MSEVRNNTETVKLVQAGSEEDDSWKVEFYEEDFHCWTEMSDPSTYDDAVKTMKELEELGHLANENFMAADPDRFKHLLRVRKVGTDDFIMNDLIC